MRVLLITTSYPPTSGSHTQRIIPMVNTLVSKGIDLFVFTQDTDSTWPAYDTELLKRINASIMVYRAPVGRLHRFKNSNSTNIVIKSSKKSLVSQIKQYIIKCGQSIKKRILLPDTMVDWYFEAIRYEKNNQLVKNISPDVILSCSMPNTVHLVGYRLSKKYNVPLYVDIADPWAYDGDYWKKTFSIRFIIQRHLENKIINHAVGSSYSAPGCKLLYIEKYHLKESDTVSVVTGFERGLMERAKGLRCVKEGSKVFFTYGGALEEAVRNPKPFFKAANKYINSIELLLRTDDVAKAKMWLKECGNPSNILIDHYIKFDDYFKEMMSSDIILFFGNSNDIQLPGKIFNCVVTGKYILYLKSNNIENDTVEQILASYKRGIVVPNEQEQIENTLGVIIDRISELRKTSLTENGDISQFSEEFQFSKLYNHLTKSLKNHNND